MRVARFIPKDAGLFALKDLVDAPAARAAGKNFVNAVMIDISSTIKSNVQ